MKTRLLMLISALSASLFCLPVLAQPGPGMGGQGMGGPGMSGPGGGSQNQAAGSGTNAQKQGMKAPRDCSKALHPDQCKARQEARQAAQLACQNEMGPARRQCMQNKMPPPDCSKTPNPERCALRQKSREACKDKLGPEHKSCMQAQLTAKP